MTIRYVSPNEGVPTKRPQPRQAFADITAFLESQTHVATTGVQMNAQGLLGSAANALPERWRRATEIARERFGAEDSLAHDRHWSAWRIRNEQMADLLEFLEVNADFTTGDDPVLSAKAGWAFYIPSVGRRDEDDSLPPMDSWQSGMSIITLQLCARSRILADIVLSRDIANDEWKESFTKLRREIPAELDESDLRVVTRDIDASSGFRVRPIGLAD